MAKRILIRRDTTENWEQVNPVLSDGELGIEIKSNGKRSVKLGTGGPHWNDLEYFVDNPASAIALENHENNTSVHGATAIPASNLIVKYNQGGGLKSNKVPEESNDVLRKTELDAINSDMAGLQLNIDTVESDAKQYADSLALATQKWLPAVQTSALLPANPGDGTWLCRVITGDDYGVYQWIGTQETPEWTFFSDNLDFIDRIANPVADNLPVITEDGELIDSGESISGIVDLINEREPLKYIADNESDAYEYSTENPTVMVFYPEE